MKLKSEISSLKLLVKIKKILKTKLFQVKTMH